MDAILKRRSIRRYKKDEDVTDEVLGKILEAAMSAPSAGNEQPWHFIIVRNKDKLTALSGFSPFASALKFASLGIVVCGDLTLERHEGFWVQDCSAAVENILIEASFLGLGAVWLGVYPLQDRIEYIKKQFDLSDSIIPFSVIPVGYPVKNVPLVKRYRSERVHFEEW